MKRLARMRPSPAMVVALIALGVALGGTSYAAIGGGGIINNSLKSEDVRNNSLTGRDVKNSSLDGREVRNRSLSGSELRRNALTGTHILESRLGKVTSARNADAAGFASRATLSERSTLADRASRADRTSLADSATQAGNANTVGGLSIVPFVYRSDDTTTRTTLASVGGLRLQAVCPSGSNDLLFVNLSGGTAEITLTNVDLTDNNSSDHTEGVHVLLADNQEENAAPAVPSTMDSDGVNGQAGLIMPGNRVVRVLYTLNEGVDGFDCSISGLVIG
jgi:hypothetical protein